MTHSYGDGHGSHKHACKTSPNTVHCTPHENPTDEAEAACDEQVRLSPVPHDRERVRDAAMPCHAMPNVKCVSLLYSPERNAHCHKNSRMSGIKNVHLVFPVFHPLRGPALIQADGAYIWHDFTHVFMEKIHSLGNKKI
jgi:hypothetical protein